MCIGKDFLFLGVFYTISYGIVSFLSRHSSKISTLWFLFDLYFSEDPDDIDPDAVKASLSELLQNLKDSERKKEESLVKVDSLQSAVGHLEEERAGLDGKLRAVHQEMNQLKDQKRLLEERLNSAETALTLQVRDQFLFSFHCG